MKCVVNIKKKVTDKLEKIPDYIVDKLEYWVNAVETHGISIVRKIPGYHDEPLQGDRKGQRSIRLNKAYRAIYEETIENSIRIILISIGYIVSTSNFS